MHRKAARISAKFVTWDSENRLTHTVARAMMKRQSDRGAGFISSVQQVGRTVDGMRKGRLPKGFDLTGRSPDPAVKNGWIVIMTMMESYRF